MTWHEYFLSIVKVVKEKSKDRSTKIGSVLVKDNQIISTGYNSFPKGFDDNLDSNHERPLKYQITEHSERNAIYQCAKRGISTFESVLYTTTFPCSDCMRAIASSGINKVIIDVFDFMDTISKWRKLECKDWISDYKISLQIAKNSRVVGRAVDVYLSDGKRTMLISERCFEEDYDFNADL